MAKIMAKIINPVKNLTRPSDNNKTIAPHLIKIIKQTHIKTFPIQTQLQITQSKYLNTQNIKQLYGKRNRPTFGFAEFSER